MADLKVIENELVPVYETTSTAQTNLHSKEKWKKETTEYSYNER